ncbi:MAG: TonB C-terminal domain-containing protein [Candidatus Acidiferrales bacterium]
MIPRILVPRDLRASAKEDSAAKPRRLSSTLDGRMVVPSDLPVAVIDPRSAIPQHVPLDVLSKRLLIPRDMPVKPLVETTAIPQHIPLSVLDSRTVVPREVQPLGEEALSALKHAEPHFEAIADIREPDVLTSGEVNLLVNTETQREPRWERMGQGTSVIFHVALIILALSFTKLFPPHVPTREELELARRQLSFIYLPPGMREPSATPSAPQPPTPPIRVDPRILREVAPPSPQPAPALPAQPNPAPTPNLPSAPTPHVPVTNPSEQPALTVPANPAPRDSRTENPVATQPPPGKLNLSIPNLSPGKSVEQSVRGAMQKGGTSSRGFEGPIPHGPGSAEGAPGNGGGAGQYGGGAQILTPTEGVDFSSYLDRLVAVVKENWEAVIPESARMGERGKVVIQFRIMRDGSVPFPEPNLLRTSGKEPLDRAAMSSIRASTPFEPLPPAFSGPFIELRFTFFYNLPIDAQ